MGKFSVLDIGTFEATDDSVSFYCNSFQKHLQTHHKVITVPHKHNFFLTVLFTQGSGIHEIDFERYPIQSGSVFMLNPGQTHYWELSHDADGIIFFHSQEFFDLAFSDRSVFDFPFFYSLLNPSSLLLPKKEAASIFLHFEQLLKEYLQPGSMSSQMLTALLSCIYIELSRVYTKMEGERLIKQDVYSEYLRKLEILIDSHYREEKSPSAYAEMLHITTRHLNRLTHQMTGKSTTQLITERVLLEAKRMLVHDSGSLTNVACELGYEDYAYFSRLFKKWTGLTPSTFSETYRSSSVSPE